MPTDAALDDGLLSADASVIFMDVGHVGERLAIAVVGTLADGKPFSRTVATTVLRCLPNDLGRACQSFGAIVAADYVEFMSGGRPSDAWQLPLGGLAQSAPLHVEGSDLSSIVASVARLCALCDASPLDLDSVDSTTTTPRVSDELRFLEGVVDEVARREPKLAQGFKRKFNLAGGRISSEIDFVGHRYATCYAAVSPKARGATRAMTASAALWRLARARDAFGFGAPTIMELTAWVPPRGLPIYSEADYDVVKELIAELRAQAKREELGVSPAHNFAEAAERLIECEGNDSRAPQ